MGDDAWFALDGEVATYFYPRPPRGGRPRELLLYEVAQNISIHVPRVGDDTVEAVLAAGGNDISIHVPRVGDDRYIDGLPVWRTAFLSTSPAWGTTSTGSQVLEVISFLSTSPAWGTTLLFTLFRGFMRYFYPRPPRGGRRFANNTSR